ncbi:GATA type zinc finger [Ceratobasidium sp. AG-Ba]|nr:GATA type zinc finger [Ceratobasidium sp. AG-Ba]
MEPLRLPPIRDLRLNHDDDYAGAPPRDQRLAKVVDNCKELCRFADHYGMPLDARPRTCLTLFPATNHPHKPAEGEIAVMVQYAEEVIAMLRDYRRVACPPSPSPAPVPTIPAAASPARPPKRPWEDAEHVPQRIASSSPAERPSPDSSSSPPRVAPAQEAHMHVFDGVPERVVPMDDDARAVAARDMEDIRARRAAGQGAGQGKIKYKKRSVTSPAPESATRARSSTPPNGAAARTDSAPSATLAAFVRASAPAYPPVPHPSPSSPDYAKLVRKRDRIISTLPVGGPHPPPIDIDFLRKSARAAAENSAIARSVGRRRAAEDKDRPSSTKRPADSELVRDSASTRRGWGRREVDADEPMRSPIQSSFARAQMSPYPPVQSTPHMSPDHLASPAHASPIQSMVLPPDHEPASSTSPMHNHTLPSLRPSYPPPMAYPPPPWAHIPAHMLKPCFIRPAHAAALWPASWLCPRTPGFDDGCAPVPSPSVGSLQRQRPRPPA